MAKLSLAAWLDELGRFPGHEGSTSEAQKMVNLCLSQAPAARARQARINVRFTGADFELRQALNDAMGQEPDSVRAHRAQVTLGLIVNLLETCETITATDRSSGVRLDISDLFARVVHTPMPKRAKRSPRSGVQPKPPGAAPSA
jgi:hypothetical protein